MGEKFKNYFFFQYVFKTKLKFVYLPMPLDRYKIMKSLNIFFSETTWPIFFRFHIGPSVEGMLTICSNGCAPCIKIFFSSTKKALRLNLDIQHRGLKVYQVYWNDDTRMTIDLFMEWSDLCPSCCGNTGRMLHGICKYAIAVFIRLANCGPWASCL